MVIEVEHRGLLTKEKFIEIKAFLDKNAKFLGEKDRFSILYFQTKAKNSFERKEEVIDLKVRITNKKSELVMKHGVFGGKDARKEFSFNLESNKFDDMVELLHILGFHHGVLHDTKTFVYFYNNVEISLVEVPN